MIQAKISKNPFDLPHYDPFRISLLKKMGGISKRKYPRKLKELEEN
ncbi:hypothetical protein [Flagellimonas olearia]|nr:hypothetical protein [Allomuricauda olearia]